MEKRKMEINDLIGAAVANALTRRELVETLSDEEATSVAGGLTVEEAKLSIYCPTIAGFKPIQPIQPIKPIKPICPIVVGLIYIPDEQLPLA